MPVNTPHSDYEIKLPQWTRCRTVYEGQDAVKAAGEAFLPKLDSHYGTKGATKYAAYKQRALFFNATGRTVDGLAGGVFQKAPTTDANGDLKKHLVDLTLTNVSFESLALETMKEVLKVGRIGLLVEMADSAENPSRPYWVVHQAENITSWRTARISGDEMLTLVVLREYADEPNPDDPFASAPVEQYRVLRLRLENDRRIYEQCVYTLKDRNAPKDKQEWVAGAPIVPLRRGTPLSFIPFVFINPTSVGPKPEKPPLLDLVDVNISHYQTMADLEHGRHFCGLPQPWVRGGPQGDEPLAIGSGNAWMLSGDHGQAGMLEFTGQGLGALENADKQKRQMMATLGARMLESQSSHVEAAKTVEMRSAGEHASLRTIAGSTQQGLQLGLQFHRWWIGTEIRPSDVSVSVALNKDFMNVDASPDKIRVAITAVQEGELSSKEFFGILQRGNWIDQSSTFDAELAQRKAEMRLAEGGALDVDDPEQGDDRDDDDDTDADDKPELRSRGGA